MATPLARQTISMLHTARGQRKHQQQQHPSRSRRLAAVGGDQGRRNLVQRGQRGESGRPRGRHVPRVCSGSEIGKGAIIYTCRCNAGSIITSIFLYPSYVLISSTYYIMTYLFMKMSSLHYQWTSESRSQCTVLSNATGMIIIVISITHEGSLS
jgi:hypothetical protein